MLLMINFFSLTLGYVIATGNSLPDDCGMQPIADESGDSRILFGAEVTPHSYPWEVAIFKESGKFCGGSLISHKHVITAGHCIILHCSDGCEVILGAHNILKEEPGQIRIPITLENTVVHEGYSNVSFIENKDKPIIFENDIGLITFKEEIGFSDTIRPICLQNKMLASHGDTVTVTGWSVTETEGDHQRGLVKTNSIIVDKAGLLNGTFTSLDLLSDVEFSFYKAKIIKSLAAIGRKCRIQKNTTLDEFKAIVKEAIDKTPMDQTVVIYNGGRSGPCKFDTGGTMNFKRPDGRFNLIGTGSSTLLLCLIAHVPDPAYYSSIHFHYKWIMEHIK